MNKQFRHFAFTWNNYATHDTNWQANLDAQLKNIGANYYIYAREIGEKGTPHLQGYVQLNTRKYFNVLKQSLHPTIHITVVSGSSQDNINYCKKVDKNPVEHGELREIGRARAKQERDWQLLLELAKCNKMFQIEQDDPRDYIIYYKTLRQIALDNLDSKALVRRCLWIHGKPGTGKSRVAHNLFPNAYWKNVNKWWDGYRGEQTVVMDDFDTPVLFSYLKRWADRYKVIGEVKGSSVGLTYEQFIITSNFTPQQLADRDLAISQATVEAVERRFLIVEAQEWDELYQDLIVTVKNCYGKTLGSEPPVPVPLSPLLLDQDWVIDYQTSV